MERQTLLRQLDVLRLRFKQSIIPKDIEHQKTGVVKLVVERNLARTKLGWIQPTGIPAGA